MAKTAEFMGAEEFVPVIRQIEAPEEKTQYDEKLDELIDSFKSTPNATVTLYRQKGTNINDGLTFLDSFPPDKYTREQIMKLLRDEYGTGDYRIHVRVKGKLKANELLSIEVPEKRMLNQRGEISEIIETVLTRLDRMQQALFSQPQKTASEVEHDFLQKMLLYKQLFGQQQSNNGLQEMLALITGLKSAGLITTPADQEKDITEKDGFMGFLSGMMPTIKTIAETSLQNSQQNRIPPIPQKPVQVSEPVFTSPQNQPLSDHVQALVSMALMTLCNAAEKNADADLYAQWVLDQLPDDNLDEFLDMLDAPNWLDTLDGIGYGKPKLYATWFTQVREKILLSVTAEYDDGEIDNNIQRD